MANSPSGESVISRVVRLSALSPSATPAGVMLAPHR